LAVCWDRSNVLSSRRSHRAAPLQRSWPPLHLPNRRRTHSPRPCHGPRGSSGRRFVVALIPAHNEEGEIGDAIRSLRDQETPRQLVVVFADNCTDATARVAEAQGAYVLSTSKNENKKAGALSRALEQLLPALEGDDCVLVSPSPVPGVAARRDFSPKVPEQGRRAVK
jgi:cellulose synthase/poly-beta-1,6-N-acetylglucosamine synthase-like glycosyltransferase